MHAFRPWPQLVIDPAGPNSPLILGVVFGLLIAALVTNAVLKNRGAYRRFAKLHSSRLRRATMRKWLISSVALLGGSALITSLLAWRYVPLLLADIDAIPFVAGAHQVFEAGGWISWGILVALVVLVVGGGTVTLFLVRNDQEIITIGDIHAILPRNRKELPYGAALSINAGISEEMLFRFAMPALIFAFTGNALLAVILSVLIFGALHAYQGIAGVVGTTVIGALFMAIYLATGNILVVIVLHALVDLRSLILIPMVINRVHRT